MSKVYQLGYDTVVELSKDKFDLIPDDMCSLPLDRYVKFLLGNEAESELLRSLGVNLIDEDGKEIVADWYRVIINGNSK